MGNSTPHSRLPHFSLRLPASTKSRWQEAAEQEGRTLAGYIKHAVELYTLAITRAQQQPKTTVWLCAKCGYGSEEHGIPGHPAHLCVADMREMPAASCGARP